MHVFCNLSFQFEIRLYHMADNAFYRIFGCAIFGVCVSSLQMQIVLFLLCTIPFWTSNVIRMISWIPLLGRNGLVNSTMQNMGLIDGPTAISGLRFASNILIEILRGGYRRG